MDHEATSAQPSVAEFDDGRDAFLSAIRRGQTREACRVYAADARLLVPSADPIEGRAAIELYWQTGIDAGMTDIALEQLAVAHRRGFAYEIGRYAMHLEPADGVAVEDRGKYVVLHEVQPDGSWRWAVEMFNPDEPPAPRPYREHPVRQ